MEGRDAGPSRVDEFAPWFVMPADKKWFRDLAIAETMRNALMPFKDEWLKKLEELGREKKKGIDEYRRGRNKQ